MTPIQNAYELAGRRRLASSRVAQQRGRNVRTIPGFDPVASDHSAILKRAFEAGGSWWIPPETELRIAYGTRINPPTDFALEGAHSRSSVIRCTGFTVGDSHQSDHTFNVFGKGNTVPSAAERLIFRNLRILGAKGGGYTVSPQQQPAPFGFYGVTGGTTAPPMHLMSATAHDWIFESLTFEDIEGYPIHTYGYENRVRVSDVTVKNANNGINCNSSYSTFERIWFIDAEGIEAAGVGLSVEEVIVLNPVNVGVSLNNTGFGAPYQGGRILNCAVIGHKVGQTVNVALGISDNGSNAAYGLVQGCLVAYVQGEGLQIDATGVLAVGNQFYDCGRSDGVAGQRLAIEVTANGNAATLIGNKGRFVAGTAVDGATYTMDHGIIVRADDVTLQANDMDSVAQAAAASSWDIGIRSTAQRCFLDASNRYRPGRLQIDAGASFRRGSYAEFLPGVTYPTIGGRPTAGVDFDGMTAFTPGGAGVADALVTCLKDAANAYAWVA